MSCTFCLQSLFFASKVQLKTDFCYKAPRWSFAFVIGKIVNKSAEWLIINTIKSWFEIFMSSELVDNANKIAGEILRIAVNVENDLEHFLMYYILGFSSNKQNFLRDEILQKMNFQRKVELFEKISKLEKFDLRPLKKILSDIKFIQERRNKVAHWESSLEGPPEHPEQGEIRLWSPKSLKHKKDTLVLNQEILNEINKRYFSASKGIVEVTNYLIEQDRKDDSPDFLTRI